MNGKVLVSVAMPGTRAAFSVWIPRDVSVQMVTDLLVELLQPRESAWFCAADDTSLMRNDTGDLLDPGSYIGDAELVNGAKLTLV